MKWFAILCFVLPVFSITVMWAIKLNSYPIFLTGFFIIFSLSGLGRWIIEEVTEEVVRRVGEKK